MCVVWPEEKTTVGVQAACKGREGCRLRPVERVTGGFWIGGSPDDRVKGKLR